LLTHSADVSIISAVAARGDQKAVGEPVKVIPGPKDLEEKRYRFHHVAPDWETS